MVYFEAVYRKSKFFFGFSLFKPPFEDKIYEKIKNYFDKFIEMKNMTDEEIINITRSHKIDIAIDLNGFTGRNRFNIFIHQNQFKNFTTKRANFFL